MHVELSFWEAVALVAMLVGAAWALLKLNAVQFQKGLDSRFSQIKEGMENMEKASNSRYAAQDKKLEHIDGLMTKISDVEKDSLRRHAEYIDKFATKPELKDASEKTSHALEQIFGLLRQIRDDLHGKVSREECDSCQRHRP